jgi:hypothetical protein
VTDLKARAAANPAAVAALAAGVAWRLFHRPPVATLLVGLGLFGLLRTSPSQADYAKAEEFFDPEEWSARASNVADAAKQKVQDWGAPQRVRIKKNSSPPRTPAQRIFSGSLKPRLSGALSFGRRII